MYPKTNNNNNLNTNRVYLFHSHAKGDEAN
jgi:hypothetical protein